MIPNYGKYAMINMHSWMFLSSYEELRNSIIRTQSVDSLLHLGPHTFDEISGEIVQNASFVITKNKENQEKKIPNSFFYRLIDGNSCSSKEQLFLNAIASTLSSYIYITKLEFFKKFQVADLHIGPRPKISTVLKEVNLLVQNWIAFRELLLEIQKDI